MNRPPGWTRGPVVGLLACATVVAAGCGPPQPYRLVTQGNVERGRKSIVAYGCGACHTIPGIREARGLVGPPLAQFARRSYIAGQVPNNSHDLIRWISTPQAIEPGTAMPDLGVTTADARDIAAYLYTLR